MKNTKQNAMKNTKQSQAYESKCIKGMSNTLRIGVIADIHSNHFALEACLAYLEAQQVDEYLFLGDYVSDCPYPQKTMQILYALMEKKKCSWVHGNREDYMLEYDSSTNRTWVNNSASGNLLYTYENLTKRDLAFFSEMPIAARFEREGYPPFLYCHGSPINSRELLQFDADNTKQVLEQMDCELLVNAHTHIQGTFQWKGKQLVNPGASGNPMFYPKKAPCAILTGKKEGWSVELLQIPYDTDALMVEYETSGLRQRAPEWVRGCKQTILTGVDQSWEWLQLATRLCREAEGSCEWPNIPEKYWDLAGKELDIPVYDDFILKMDEIDQ